MAKRSFNMWLDASGNKQAHRELKEQLKKEPKLAEVLKLNEDISFSEFDSFTYNIFRKEQDAGKIDTYDTMGAAARYVDANNLRGEFDAWLESLMEQAGAKEVFFAGYTRSGDRIYKDNTLENVSRHMRLQGRTNAYDDHGLSATKSALLQRLTSLSQIRKNKARLQNESAYNKEYDALKDRLWSIISQLADMQEISSNQFMNVDYAESRLQEAITKRNPIAHLNKEYGYDIDPAGEYADELNSFIKDVQQMPAKYFETKFERPVYLNEFAAAVMPTTTSEDIKQAVSEAGLPIFEYDSEVEDSRKEATLKATEGEGIRFRILGEKGAVNLDKAEEATIRLDNLAIARQMEKSGKDAKAIKLATGWERGVDKLWRYEVHDDFDLSELESRLQESLNDGLSKAWGIVYPSDLGELTKAYPDFNVDIMVWVGDEFENTGEYSPATEGDETTFGRSASIEVKAKTVADIKDVLVHEIQHAIQEKEGFAEGGSVFGLKDKLSAELDKRVARIKELRAEGRDAEADELMSVSKGLAEAVINNDADTYQNYRKLAGEVEARNVSARLKMSEQERRESLLSETEDVAREDQIVLMDGLGVSEMGTNMLRTRITPEQDAAYLKAVEAGDMETAQRMVDEAAKLAMPNTKVVDENGNPKVVYHGTGSEFYTFRKTNDINELGTGYYFSDSYEMAERYATDETLADNRLRAENLAFEIFTEEMGHSEEEYDYVNEETEDDYNEAYYQAVKRLFGNGHVKSVFLNIENPFIVGSRSDDLPYRSLWQQTDEAHRLNDGIIDPEFTLRHETLSGNQYVAFKPSQIKSADPVTYDDAGNVIPLSKRFNPENADIRFRTSNNNQAIFVSNAAKAVEGIKMEKATPEQWLKMIEKNGGLKAGEDKWMGLSDFLKSSDKKTLTKQEVLDFVNEHTIVIEEQHYSEDENALDGKRQEIQEALQGIFDEYVAESEDMNDDMFMNTHYNYAIQKLEDELGYTAFNAPFVNNNAIVELDFYEDDLDTLHELSNKLGLEKYDGTRNINDTRLSYTTEGLTDKHEIALIVPTIEPWDERDDVHFGDAGDGRAVAWIRFGDAKKLLGTTEVDGKKKFNWAKVLVIDEIQSNRHQEGREKGYRSKDYWKRRTDYLAARTMHDGLYDEMKAKYGDDWINADTEGDVKRLVTEEEFARLVKANEELDAAADAYKGMVNAIPDAPFDKNWHELAMKRMLRYAAENGYDAIAWTKGEQQAERYNIGKVIDSIYYGNLNGNKIVRLTLYGADNQVAEVDSEGRVVAVHSGNMIQEGMSLAEIVGKEIALKIINNEGEKIGEDDYKLSGEGLRVGGEGMKGFYDKMLPAFMNKYGKKWGIKVEDIHLNLEGGLDMHSIPVTEEMKASVMEGQTMFRTRRSDESPAEFLKDAVAEFENKYNVAAPASIIKVPTRREFAKALDLEVADIDEQFHNVLLDAWKNAFGMYLPLYDEDNNITHNIVIFAKDTHQASYISDASLFHENIHGFVKDNPELLELGRWLYETDVQDRNILTIRPLADTYPEHKRHEEMLTHYVSMMMAVGGSQRALDTLPEEYKPLLNYIYERFGYNPETEDGERLRRYDSESREISGRTWTNGQGVTVTKGERESDGNGNLFRTTGTPTEQVVNDGIPLSVEEFTNLAADIYKNMPEDIRRDVVEYASRNRYDLKNAVFQISASLAEKAELTDEEIELAKMVAQKVEDAVLASGVEMTRPFTTNEALWMLYQSTIPTSEYNLIGNARKAVVADNLGFSKSQQAEQEKDADNIRFRSARGTAANSAAAMYNNEQRSAWGMLRETYQDMYRSVKSLMQSIEKATGKDAQSWENILTSLNALSSKNLADKKKYLRDFLTPMWDAALAIRDKYHKSLEQIERYLMIKHGLERNKVLAARDARNFYREQANQEIAAIKADKSLSKAEQKTRIQRVEDTYNNHVSDIEAGIDAKFQEFRAKDYGGLTALFSDFADYGTREDYESEELYQEAALAARTPKFATLAETEIEAQKEVDAFEKEVDKTLVDNLWKKINAATKETLRHQYANNMLTKEQYERVRDMFEFYVPLRGFVDTTAEDTYSYYVSGQQSKFANPLQGAKGRKTQAETPLGWIGSMAESAIQMDNKNTAKLALYYFAVNRPNNDILKITPTWYEWTGEMDSDGKKIFEPVYPTFNGPQSGPAMQAQMDAFESMMEQQAQAGNAYKGKQRIDLKEAVIRAPKSTPEHIVTVKVAGEDYSIIINANPRAAQAINGMLNIDKGDNPLYRAARAILRFQASIKTSLAPLFWITNFMRDVSFAFINTSIRNDVGYTKEFANNYPHAFRVFSYVHKNRKSALGNTKYEKYYTEFAENGGITGYTSLTNNTEYDQMMKTYAKNARAGKFIKGIKGALEVYQDLGESFEQVSRFAAYITARESGKDISESIYEAKEVAINFNRKGSGKAITWEESGKMRRKSGKPLTDAERIFFVTLGGLSPVARSLFMFFNAGMQGVRMIAKLAHEHPGKSAAWAGIVFTMGLINAIMHAMMEDDDEYLDMPDYVRRTNILIGKNGTYFKWSLPHEVRPFYAMADIFVQHAMGRKPNKNIAAELAETFGEWMPINPFKDGLNAFMPDIIRPFVEIKNNKDFTGSPIYREYRWLTEEQQKNMPAYEKGFDSTSKVLVDISEILNDVSGGDQTDAGFININPAVVEHLAQEYGGGPLKLAEQFFKTIGVMTGDQEFSIRNTPFLSTFMVAADDRYRNAHTTELFKYYKGMAEDVKRRAGEYKAEKDNVGFDKLRASDDFQIFQIYRKYEKRDKFYNEQLKRAKSDSERKEIMSLQDAHRKRMIEEISKL